MKRARELFPPPIRRINLYVALRNQAKEAHPKRALRRVLGKRLRLCADRDETPRGGSFALYLYEFGDVFRQGARDASRSRNERDGRYGHVGRKWRGDGRESKPKVIGAR